VRPVEVKNEDVTAIQNYVDLYTALRRVAEEERENLRIRFAQLAAWTGSIPEEKITLHSDVAMDGGEELAAPEQVLVEGGWTCSSCGHNNTAEVSFCEECGGKRPEAQVAAPMPPEKRLCENGHEMPPEAAFCPRCGKPEKRPEEPKLRLCENGHEMPPEAAFCPKCGKPEKRPEEPKLRLCENGHEIPPEAAFCPRCGKPEKRPEEPKLRLCENGHEMRPNARFCSKCGRPVRA
jgi:membrane protease subunit (stomatin/prohibitin family)